MEYLRKYATATHCYVPLIKRAVVDFAVSADWTPATGDVKISIDGGAAANVTNLPTAITMGNTAMWDFSLTSGELTGKKINITVADSATKAVEDQMFSLATYGHASAEYILDLGINQTGDSYAVVNSGTFGNSALKTLVDTLDDFVDTEVAAIKAKTDNLPASPASTTNITAGTITTVTNLTNLPASAALEASLQSLITTVAALNNLSAAGVRTSVGLATANLDTQLAALAAYIDTEVATLLAAVSDLQTRTPAALTADGNMKADTLRISGSATAADNLEEGSKALVTGTCAAGCTTTSIVTNLTEATDDHYNGRVITFTGGPLIGQTKGITDYVGATKTLTVAALTEAPASTDPFVIS